MCRFSIIVVCLNAGEKLGQTIDSILKQDYQDYEIIVKDGGSSDGSVEKLSETCTCPEKMKIFTEKDSGIYDAMNQAIGKATGEYVLFLNCGDSFYREDVLSKTAGYIEERESREERRDIFYGDTFCEKVNSRVASPRKITPFVCYRNIPCHQSCFYKRELFTKKQYDLTYRIRADYDHFLWCVLKDGVNPVFMDMVVSGYEGGGFSESKANRKRDRQEHKEITEKYLSKGQLFCYRLYMVLTLVPLRRFLAENKAFSGIYNKLKAGLYR